MSSPGSALAPHPGAPLAKPAKPGFFAGTAAFFSGVKFITLTPASWPLAVVPLAVTLVLTGVVGGTAMHFLSPWIVELVGPRYPGLAAALKVVAALITLGVSGVLSLSLAQPFSGPALNGIVRRAEALEGAPAWPATSFFTDIGRSFQSMAITYAFGLPLLAILWAVTFFVPPASIVTVPLKFVVLAIMTAWDLCDYPLSARGMPVVERIRLLSRNFLPMIGFGLGVALLSIIPCSLLLLLPYGVAGAAKLVLAIERAERGERADP